MQSCKAPSFFQDLKTRELNGFKVRKRPHLDDLSSDSSIPGTGVLTIEHNSHTAPPLSVSFCKSSRNCHFLAVSDEDGYVSFYDTRRKLPAFSAFGDNAEVRVCDWIAHQNAVFDVCWIKDGTQILTASGDQTIKIWDAEKRKCIGVMMEHTGSVKSLSSHPSNSDLVISGSRDGSFAFWDLRCRSSSTTRCGEACLKSVAVVKEAHILPKGKRVRRGKAANMSITSVLYLKDEISIASAGAVDSTVKFWDIRNLKASITQAHPHFEPSMEKERRLHGISSLSQDSNGVFLAASCKDHRIYLYNVLQLDKGPMRIFSGSQIESFYVKSAISPDATHILGGSSDGNAYMWQVNNPEAGPVELTGHEGEVTAVDWCPSETGKIATSADDYLVRIWNIQKGSCTNSSSPSRIRKRIIASPTTVYDELDGPPNLKNTVNSPSASEKTSMDHQSPSHNKMFTPESAEKSRFMRSLLKEELDIQKTPEAAMKSPSSVLNPPSSLKRKTIRDYFVVAS